MTKKMSKEEWLFKALEFLSKEARGIIQIDKITKALGVTKGSFYWHFKNRDDFIKNLIIYHDDTFVHSVVPYIDGLEGDAQERFSQFVSMLIRHNLGRYNDLLVLLAISEPKFSSLIKKSYKARIEIVSSFFSEMGFQGEELEMRTRTFVIFMSNESAFIVKQTKKDRLALAKLAVKMFSAPPNKIKE